MYIPWSTQISQRNIFCPWAWIPWDIATDLGLGVGWCSMQRPHQDHHGGHLSAQLYMTREGECYVSQCCSVTLSDCLHRADSPTHTFFFFFAHISFYRTSISILQQCSMDHSRGNHMLVWMLLVVTNRRQPLPSGISHFHFWAGLTHITELENKIKRVPSSFYLLLCANWRTEMPLTPRVFSAAPSMLLDTENMDGIFVSFHPLAKVPLCCEQLTQPYMKIRPNTLN